MTSGSNADFTPRKICTDCREIGLEVMWLDVGVDRHVFFRADADYYRSSRPITDILNRYTCLV